MTAKDGDLDLEKLVRQFEEATEQQRSADELAERDRDYYDGKQLTDEEEETLRRRGQPIVVFNRVKPKIDALLGFERKLRNDPKAYPRTPKHEQDAESVTDAIRYVLEDQRFEVKRSEACENLFIEGVGALSVTVRESRRGVDVAINTVPWDRLYSDPYSRRRDFSDAAYMGIVIWMDHADAKQYGPDAEKLVQECFDNRDWSGDKHDDRPNSTAWVDSKRKRVRVCQHYWREGGQWMHAIFCRAGFLRAPEPSPYLDEDGQPECCILAQSAYIDRENNRYGVVRQMISPQDEINKRRSKALHYLNSRQVIAEHGAVDDVAQAKRELAKPDGYVEVAKDFRFDVSDPVQMAAGELQLLQEAKNEIDASGVNPALEGDLNAPSGRAVEALQQAGLAEMAVVFDGMRDLTWRVYRAVWNRIRQYWEGERWIRVTDDERNIRWVGLNTPGQAPVADLDVDIILMDAPDSLTIQSEQFQMLTEMFKAAPQAIPLDVVIEASSLRSDTKRRILEKVNGTGQENPAVAQAQAMLQEMQQQMAQMQQALQDAEMRAENATRKAEVDAAKLEVEAYKAETDRLNAQIEASRIDAEAARVDDEKAVRDEAQVEQTNKDELLIAALAAITQPKVKSGRMVRAEDGSYQFEVFEAPPMPLEPDMQAEVMNG